VCDATAKQGLGTGQGARFLCQHVHQLGLGVGPAVGQAALEMVPDALVGVQFRSVGGESDQVQASGARQQLLDGFATVDRAVVQQDEQMAGNLLKQMAQERRDLFSLDVVLVELAVQSTVAPPRADRDTRDGRDTVVPVDVANDGGLSDDSPRPADRGDQEEAGFVDKDDVGCQPRGVFFTAGHTVRFHSSIRRSSRSMARRSGAWWLQPNWCRSLPT